MTLNRSNMEKALLISPSKAETIGADKAHDLNTLIIGSEFCQNQLPGLSVLKRLARKFPGARLALATSLLTDKALLRWEALLRGLRGSGLVSEVIVNDWGLFPALEKNGPFDLSLGRLLLREFAKMDRTWAAPFLKGRGVRSAEADTPELALAAEKLGLKTSWHEPLAFKAVTTFCPFEKHFKPVCSRSCEGKLLKLSNPHLPLPLFLSEKAYFSHRSGSGLSKTPWREVLTVSGSSGFSVGSS